MALVIYTKPGCPYCQHAREYYNSKGLTFVDRDAQTNKEFRAQMLKYSGGDPTVPCIVKDGKYVQSGWGDPLRRDPELARHGCRATPVYGFEIGRSTPQR